MDNPNQSIPVMAGWAIVPLVFIGVGMYFVVTPAKNILAWDSRTGRWIYRMRLEQTGDEKKAVAAAGKFYRLFGFAFITMGALHLAFIAAMLFDSVFGGPN